MNYNVLVTNWNSSNVEDILMPCMYEDIYRIYTGENLKTQGWEIPAEEYEKIMTTYFPVSVDVYKRQAPCPDPHRTCHRTDHGGTGAGFPNPALQE